MIGDYEATYPFAAPLGFLLLISVLWMRQPRARLLFLASILPYRGAYDWLPLGMIPTTARQVLLFVLLSWMFPLVYVATGYENALIGVHLFCLLCLAVSQYRCRSEGF